MPSPIRPRILRPHLSASRTLSQFQIIFQFKLKFSFQINDMPQALDACGIPIIKHLSISLFRHLRQTTPDGPQLYISDVLGCLGMA